jgi:hypothetical protein
VVPVEVSQWFPRVAVSLALLPVVALVTVLLVRHRERRGVPRRRAARQVVAEVAMVAGTVPWIWIILSPVSNMGEVYLRPFVDIANVLSRGPVFAFFQIVGNLLVFAVFGAFAPIRWRLGLIGVTVLAGAMSISVETLQFLLHLGRVASVDDVFLNAFGATLAALASRRWWVARTPAPTAVEEPVAVTRH